MWLWWLEWIFEKGCSQATRGETEPYKTNHLRWRDNWFCLLADRHYEIKIIKGRTWKEKIKGKLNVSENNPVPAIKIGRFAIDRKYAGKGLGTYFLRSVLANILKISENNVGLRFVSVDGYASAFKFYVTHNNLKT